MTAEQAPVAEADPSVSEEPKAADERPGPALPPAKSIFAVEVQEPASASPDGLGARTGRLLGLETPTFVVLTSRGLPLHLTPQVMDSKLPAPQLWQMPIGDVLLRQDVVSTCPGAVDGCRGFWPHLKGHLTYCSFRNPRLNPSVYGGDAVCSVETAGGRRKVAPRDLLDTQRVMRVDIVAAPAEEVPLDVQGTRRLHRAVNRAGDWLKEILEAKAQEPELGFDWHVLAGIQGGSDTKLRQKACASAATMPVAGFWIGGLGYDESLGARARILKAVTSSLPAAQPRFLPLNSGSPLEVLQAVLLGVDVFEVAYPMQVASQGLALVFSCEMPADEPEKEGDEALASLLASSDASPALASSVRQLMLRAPDCREDFGPISEESPVRQYSRAYLYHLLEVRELLATMLLGQHNLYMYSRFFEAVREHIRQGTLRRFASWFLRTQTSEPLAAAPPGLTAKRRRT